MFLKFFQKAEPKPVMAKVGKGTVRITLLDGRTVDREIIGRAFFSSLSSPIFTSAWDLYLTNYVDAKGCIRLDGNAFVPYRQIKSLDFVNADPDFEIEVRE